MLTLISTAGGACAKKIPIVYLVICMASLCLTGGASAWADDSRTEAQWSVQRAKLTADVASKRPLRQVIKEAVEAGLDIEKAVATLIEAGADSQAVVYTAILEGYPACQAVKGVLEAHADLQLAVSAAISAGADSMLLCRCAVDAGVSPEVCAEAVASASAPEAPVYGYSRPTSQSFIYFPGTGSVVYGGGSGTTKEASPHKP